MNTTHACIDSDVAFADAESLLLPCSLVVIGGGSDGNACTGERTRSGSLIPSSNIASDPDATGAVAGVETEDEIFEVELGLVVALVGEAAMGTTGVVGDDVDMSAGEADSEVGPSAAAAIGPDVAAGTSPRALSESMMRAVSASLDAELTE